MKFLMGFLCLFLSTGLMANDAIRGGCEQKLLFHQVYGRQARFLGFTEPVADSHEYEIGAHFEISWMDLPAEMRPFEAFGQRGNTVQPHSTMHPAQARLHVVTNLPLEAISGLKGTPFEILRRVIDFMDPTAELLNSGPRPRALAVRPLPGINLAPRLKGEVIPGVSFGGTSDPELIDWDLFPIGYISEISDSEIVLDTGEIITRAHIDSDAIGLMQLIAILPQD